MNIHEAKQRFLEYLQHERRFSPYTVRNYGQAVEYLAAHVGDVEVAQVRLEHLRRYLVDAPYVKKSLHHQASAWRHFFTFCLEREWLTQVPTLGLTLPKPEKPLPLFPKFSMPK